MVEIIFVGSDHAGFGLKCAVCSHLTERGFAVNDLGVGPGERGDYPVFAFRVAEAVALSEDSFGIVFCGSGVGASITANKVAGIRCVVCSEPYSGLMARRHNNANMLALGQRVVGDALAILIVDTFLDHEFEGGRHARRLGMISEVERGGKL